MNLKATRVVNVRELARILHEIQMAKMLGKFEFNQQREGEIYFQNKQDRTPVVWPTFEHGYPFIADTKVEAIALDDAMSRRWGLETCNVVACTVNQDHTLACDICTHLKKQGFEQCS
jgi:hypothetical protein